MRAVLSSDAVTTRVPSGEKAADQTVASRRRGSPTCLPDLGAFLASQSANRKPVCSLSLHVAPSLMRAVLSHDAVTTRLPSGEKAADKTAPSWRRGSPTCLPVATSQMRAVQ